MQKTLYKLENVIQDYAWGSHRALSEQFGIANPEHRPQAELWMGAHPSGCSRLDDGRLLSELIQAEPGAVLGDYTQARFGDLPFLFKVLAAAQPLSVQVHPRQVNASQGFQREQGQGIPLKAAERNYKDTNHKPELLYALTFFRALKGFRAIDEIVDLFRQAGIESLQPEVDALADSPGSKELRRFFARVMTLAGLEKEQALSELSRAVDGQATTVMAREAFKLVRELSESYPGDIGLFSPLLLNIFELEPGEATFQHAETPHAYIQGTGLEIMANSDNVLRAGLTAKHIDIPELIANTRFESIRPEKIRLSPSSMENKTRFAVPVDDFAFELLQVSDRPLRQYVRGPEILMCLSGEVSVSDPSGQLMLRPGESAFICYQAGSFSYHGAGLLARVFN